MGTIRRIFSIFPFELLQLRRSYHFRRSLFCLNNGPISSSSRFVSSDLHRSFRNEDSRSLVSLPSSLSTSRCSSGQVGQFSAFTDSILKNRRFFIPNMTVRNLRTVAWHTDLTPEFSSSPLRNQTRLFADIDRSSAGNKSQTDGQSAKDDPVRLSTRTSVDNIEEIDDSKLTLTQRFKKLWKQYWYVLLPVHAVTSCAWFGIFYGVSASGLDVIGFLEYLHIPDSVLDHIRNAPQAGHVVVALALYKIVTPLRYMSTVGVTYFAIKSLSKLGYIKPMPNRKQLKAMIDEKRDQFRKHRHRWRTERRFIVFRRRSPPLSSSNGHHHQSKKPHD